MMEKIGNYINGELVAPESGNYLENIEPATGKAYSLVADSDAADVEAAVKAACAAFPEWSSTPVADRAAVMETIAELIDKNLRLLSEAESRDNGKPVRLAAKVDIPRASANMRFYAGAMKYFSSESHMTDDVALNYTTRMPHGVAGCISPWNLPLYLFTWKIAPALAAGNTVVAKPSEITPMTAYLFSKLCIEAGLPPGVLNIVYGLGHKAGQALVAHPRVPVISFTGGTTTGAAIAKTAAPMFKKLSLELGGKNPNIIFADADLEEAIKISLQSSFSNQGEICLCGSRIFVERPVYKKFLNAFAEKTRQLVVGDPGDNDTQVGAVVSENHLNKILSYVNLAREEGGEVVVGGKCIKLKGRCSSGYYMQPTVITGLTPACRTNREEIFGPVVTVTPFDDEEEVLDYANSTDYGLSATIWTQDLKKAHRVAHKVKSGVVWVNCWLLRDLRTPFGGMKQSGLGREGGFDALRFFTEEKNICIKL